MSRATTAYRRLLRREVLDICAFIFVADVVAGIQSPLFPLYATSLGTSFGLLGLVTAVVGVTRLATAVPIGSLSDRIDRKTVLLAGMLLFAVSYALYALARGPDWLVAPRIAQGAALVATFPLGVAYIGDMVEQRDRGAAIGMYTAAMGTGFAVGPLVGSWLGSAFGFEAAYAAGAFLAIGGAAFGAVRLVRRRSTPGEVGTPAQSLGMGSVGELVRKPVMVAACLASTAMTFSMTGAIFTFFPIYVRGVGVSTVAIGTLFAWRSLASAAGRLPLGPLAYRLPPYWVLAGALTVEAAIDVAIAHTVSPLALSALLIVEGVGVGVYVVAGQSAVASASGATNRGAALGLFWTAGSIGDLLGPIVLGTVAGQFGLLAVFPWAGGAVIASAAAIAAVGLTSGRERADDRGDAA